MWDASGRTVAGHGCVQVRVWVRVSGLAGMLTLASFSTHTRSAAVVCFFKLAPNSSELPRRCCSYGVFLTLTLMAGVKVARFRLDLRRMREAVDDKPPADAADRAALKLLVHRRVCRAASSNICPPCHTPVARQLGSSVCCNGDAYSLHKDVSPVAVNFSRRGCEFEITPTRHFLPPNIVLLGCHADAVYPGA